MYSYYMNVMKNVSNRKQYYMYLKRIFMYKCITGICTMMERVLNRNSPNSHIVCVLSLDGGVYVPHGDRSNNGLPIALATSADFLALFELASRNGGISVHPLASRTLLCHG